MTPLLSLPGWTRSDVILRASLQGTESHHIKDSLKVVFPPTTLHLDLLPLYSSFPLRHKTASQLWKISEHKFIRVL